MRARTGIATMRGINECIYCIVCVIFGLLLCVLLCVCFIHKSIIERAVAGDGAVAVAAGAHVEHARPRTRQRRHRQQQRTHAAHRSQRKANPDSFLRVV